MEPAGLEPATSGLQSRPLDDAEEAEMPEKSDDSDERAGAPD